ncbi:dipeptide epimerase [Gramella sp. GC03-9]|uniref:Dipeptide epimerase n=1 Tax=Christiangramia oceanisediminis TaxID=2920386 RepID=A0A9X2I9L1_9FLAO|nr:dipeptide epimerase [Gramella oceanisediminis]MCP9199268.1 dipeptide epimerase [Gramella oceanisediminis]
MEFKYHSYNLELKHTFTISYGSRDFQPSLILELIHDDFHGFGEAAATSYYGVSVEKMIDSINSVEKIVSENIDKTPEEIWEICRPYLSASSFAHCALDIALHDLYARRKGQPLYKLWGLENKDLPLTSYTIGMDSVEKMIKKIKEFPWPVYKIKLGTENDVEIVKELRKHTDALFRLDANAAWSANQAIDYSHELKDLGVEFLEQPLKPDDKKGMKELYERSALPVIADESCITEGDVENCFPYFHGVNIKLTKCGGLTPARRMIDKARELGMKVMVGCMTESSVGVSAVAQLLPLLDYVDMDGPLLLKQDIAEGVKIENGKITYANRNGTGVVLNN